MTATSTRTCQVVPDIPSFSVDDGFRYRIPEHLDVQVGHRVRIRVGGRRLRGFVTAVIEDEDAPDRALVDVDGIVGTLPSFGPEDLGLLRWCASHYVSPLSVVLGRTAPPNAARASTGIVERRSGAGHRIDSVVSAAPHHEAVAEVMRDRAGGATMLVAPTVREVEDLAATLAAPNVVVAHSSLPAKTVTSAWVKAATRRDVVLVGTREIILWPVPDLGQVIVVEDSRRVMRSPSTPTLGVREVALERARLGDLPISFIAPVTSLEVLRLVPRQTVPTSRQWPLVEIADRNEEPPSSSVLLDRTRQAIIGTASRHERAFVLVPRRGYAAAFRCAECGDLRRCTACGAAITGTSVCGRCGAEAGACNRCGSRSWRPIGAGIGVVVNDLARSLADGVGGPEDGAPVTVGTERDLIGRHGLALAVAVDADGLALAPNYRAGEVALRTLVRLTQTVERGRGRRALIQTSDPDQAVIRALISGRAGDFLATEMTMRRRAGFPPFGQLIALEVSSDDHHGVGPPTTDLVHALEHTAVVLGPADVGDCTRWLITGPDLGEARMRLRRIVGALRDRGARVRVDVDPVDL